MRTALCLSGHMRCWESVFPNTEAHIISKYNPDIFISTWDTEGYWTSPENDPEGNGYVKESPVLDVTKVIEKYDPIQISVLKQSAYQDMFNKFSQPLQEISGEIRAANIYGQFYQMQACFGLMENYSLSNFFEYDLIIRMRPDIVFHEPLPELEPEKLHVLRHTNPQGRGVGDMFAAGNMENMSEFMDNMMAFEEVARSNGKFCPHEITEHALIVTQATYVVLDINKTLQHTPNGQYRDWKR